jgi:hypothetical protein
MSAWYWGGIQLQPGWPFYELLKKKGRAPTFESQKGPDMVPGRPDQATMDFINSLDPAEVIEAFSDARIAGYKRLKVENPKLRKYVGWEPRAEKEREVARGLTKKKPPPPTTKTETDPRDDVDAAQESLDVANRYAKAMTPVPAPQEPIYLGPFPLNPPQKDDRESLSDLPPDPDFKQEGEIDDDDRARGVATLFEREQRLMAAQLRLLQQQVAEGTTDSFLYSSHYAQFFERHDPWGAQLRASIAAFEQMDADRYADVIARLQALEQWYDDSTAEGAKLPPPPKQ